MRLPKWFKTHAPPRYKQHLAECATRPRVTGEKAKLRRVPGLAIRSLHSPRLKSCVKVSICTGLCQEPVSSAQCPVLIGGFYDVLIVKYFGYDAG